MVFYILQLFLGLHLVAPPPYGYICIFLLDLCKVSNSKLQIAKLHIFAKLPRHIRIRIGIFVNLLIDIRIRISIFSKLCQKLHSNCVPGNSIRTRLVTIKCTLPRSNCWDGWETLIFQFLYDM